MRTEYDVVENINVEKTSKAKDHRFHIRLLSTLVFIFICILFFSTTYHIAFNHFESLEAKRHSEEGYSESTRKAYYIEQKMRSDIQRMQSLEK